VTGAKSSGAFDEVLCVLSAGGVLSSVLASFVCTLTLADDAEDD